MITRREVVTAGVMGTLAAAPAAAAQQDSPAATKALTDINSQLQSIRSVLDTSLRGPGLSAGFIGDLRERFTVHMKAAGKFPDFMEIGTAVFYDVYDWHVRHNQQIQITRIADQRFAIQFMFTQLIVRWEQDPRYLGVPFDRG